MTNRQTRIKALFQEVVEKSSSAERKSLLNERCQDDKALRAAVLELVAHDQAMGSFLERETNALDPTLNAFGDKHIDETIGDYRIREKLGEGGMGVVYVAKQTKPVRRRVAIKIIKPGMDSKQVLARFEAERQALAMMNHPNIAKILDGGETDNGLPYFVMELVKGVPITEFCEHHRLPINERLKLFSQVCQAVQHAHQKGVIHRDLKPSNVIVELHDVVPVPKIIDFGIAKATHHELTQQSIYTQHTQLLGTPMYMSPEQAQLSALDVDTRSDVYSLGVMLYELLCGATPFDKDELRQADFDEMRRMIREVEPPRPSVKVSTLDNKQASTFSGQRGKSTHEISLALKRELDWIVMKCIEKDRTRRYESASALATDIQRYLDNDPVQACPPTAVYRLQKFVRRNRAAVVAASMVATCLILGLLGTTWQMQRAIRAEELAHNRFVQAEAARKREAQQRSEAETQRQLAEAGAIRATQQKQIAEQERAVAEAIKDFIQDDLLAMADPSGLYEANLGSYEEVKLSDLLDRADQAIKNQFDDQPEIKAELLSTIAGSFEAIGRYEDAVHLREQALQIWEATWGRKGPKTLIAMSLLAKAYLYTGDYAKSIALNEDALKLKREVFGEEHRETLVVMHNLAVGYEKTDQENRAIELLKEVLKKKTQEYGETHRLTSQTRGSLATAYNSAGNYEQAMRLLEFNVKHLKETVGPNHPRTLKTLNSLGVCYIHLGRFDEAPKFCQQVFDSHQEVFGTRSPETIRALHNLVAAYGRSGDAQKAAQLLEQELQLCKEVYGETHRKTFDCMNSLGVNLVRLGRINEAIEVHEKTVELRTDIMGPKHTQTLRSIANLASAYRLAGEFDRAIEAQERVLSLRKEILGADHPDTVSSMHELATVYKSAGRITNAIPLFEQAIERLGQRWGPVHPWVLSAKASLVESYAIAEQFDKAVELKNETLQSIRSVIGSEQHSATMAAMSKLAVSSWRMGKLDESIPLFEEVLHLQKRKFGVSHLDTIGTLANLGINYRDAGRLADAIPLLEEAYSASEHEPNGKWIGIDLLQAYLQTGDTGRADSLHAKLDATDPAPYYMHALVCLKDEDVLKYRRILAELDEQFAESEDIGDRYWLAWLRLLQPIPNDETEPALMLARTLNNGEAPAHYRLTLAATKVRCGAESEAIEELQQLHSELESGKTKSNRSTLVYCRAFLAIASRKRGEHEKAKTWSTLASNSIRQQLAENPPLTPWTRRLAYQILERELAAD